MFVLLVVICFMNLFFAGCEQPLYRAIPESIQFKNGCSFDIVVQFDTANFNRGYDFMSEAMIYTINPNTWTYPMLLKYKKYDLIMHDSIFSAIISSITIYQIDEDDTIFVNPEIYNKRTAWESTVYMDELGFHFDKYVINYFKINESMFQY